MIGFTVQVLQIHVNIDKQNIELQLQFSFVQFNNSSLKSKSNFSSSLSYFIMSPNFQNTEAQSKKIKKKNTNEIDQMIGR